MKKEFVLALFLISYSGLANTSETDGNVADARKLVKEFFEELKGELQTAMKAGGPVAAISLCNVKAAQVTYGLAERSGWEVGRTSLKLRQQKNEPDAWETEVLKSFGARKDLGENVKQIEHSEIVTVAGNETFRYMKAIPTAKLCLTCHGTEIKPEVVKALQDLYPDDQAMGFKEGDIRGAFTFSKKL